VDAEDNADEERDTDEPELDVGTVDDDVDTRMLELFTGAEDEPAEEDRDTELVIFTLTELVATALTELERDEAIEELIEPDRDAEDEVDIDADTDEEAATMVPLTFLGMTNAPPSFVDRYRATLFHWPQFWPVLPGQGFAQNWDGIWFEAEESEFPHQHSTRQPYS
jgi:hypothetical protein